MAKSSTKRANRKKPSAAKKNAASKASKAKIAPAKASRHSKKASPKLAKNRSAKKSAKPVIIRSKPKAGPAPATKKIAAKPAASVKSATNAKPDAGVKLKRPAGATVAAKSEPVRQAPHPPVATNLKPKKNLAGLGVKDLERFADQLLAKRRELVGDMSSMEREALRSGSNSNLSTLPMHMADMGTDNFEQEFTLGLVEKDRNLLREINHALSKIQNGTYGICEGTGLTISKARLEAAPWARYSIEYARQKEKNGMGVRTL